MIRLDRPPTLSKRLGLLVFFAMSLTGWSVRPAGRVMVGGFRSISGGALHGCLISGIRFISSYHKWVFRAALSLLAVRA